MGEIEPDWFAKMLDFFNLGRRMSEVALDAYRMKVIGMKNQDIARALDLKGRKKQDLQNKAKRLIEQAMRAGLPDPKKAAAYRKQLLQQDNLRRVRPDDYEKITPEALAQEFVRMGLSRDYLAKVMHKMKEIEDRVSD